MSAETLSGAARPRLVFLKKRTDYLALRSAPAAGARSLLAAGRPRGDGDDAIRIGLTVTTKLGGAVVRNRIRRRLREAARLVLPQYGEAGCDYVLIARPAAFDRAWPDLLDDLRRALLSLKGAP